MVRVWVSACLLGDPVRFHGGHARIEHPVLERWRAEGRVVPFCPEVAAGLSVPRPAAEIVGGSGSHVLDGIGRVVDRSGRDLTAAFARGSALALQVAQENGLRVAVLKDGSPSCGSRFIHDGTFSGVTHSGSGVTAAVMIRAGLRVFNESELDEADAWVRSLESSP